MVSDRLSRPKLQTRLVAFGTLSGAVFFKKIELTFFKMGGLYNIRYPVYTEATAGWARVRDASFVYPLLFKGYQVTGYLTLS